MYRSTQIARGKVARHKGINKFGRTTNVDSGVNTDIWDRANATDDQDEWTAPTQARIHTIQSSSLNDVAGGTGATTIVVSYLPDWDTPEQEETVSGNLNTGIAMQNAAVIIHRMRVVPQASSTTINDGVITATAAVDGTVTAQINAGQGQTQMALYGIPSTQKAFCSQFYGSILRANLGTTEAHADLEMLFSPDPETNPNVWVIKHSQAIASRGSNPYLHKFRPDKKFSGPGILKLRAAGSAANLDVSGGFDITLIDN